MVAGLRDSVGRADLHAGSAKNATTEIERNGFARGASDGSRRANRHADIAAVCAFAGVHLERAAVTVGHRWRRSVRIGHCFAAALQPMDDSINDKHGFGSASKIKAAVGEVEALIADREI